ncbi:uncharacterized protein [Argopecten irradians]|uniref:uncharacterized protein n=1 Tax=Argopecten irradians TaxID=31199 RepID=UPI0037171D8D
MAKVGLPSTCGPCFKQPSYKGPTTVLEAQTSQSVAQFEHELRVTPVKVDVQVTPETGPRSIFPGVGSAQRDDDESDPYGGVIYKYNDEAVTLYVPNRNDGNSNGTAIYTGGFTWSGPTHLKAKRVTVRVRAWSPKDFPCPDFSISRTVQSGSGTQSFLELAHSLGAVPEYVTVQIRHGSSNSISDGVGYVMTSPMTSINTSWGGVLYGYNESHIRIWLPSTANGHLYSSADGWGRTQGETQNTGTLIVKMWKFFNGEDFFSQTKVINNKAASVVKEVAFTSSSFDTTNDLLSVMVKATDGPNVNYLFPATGAVQNAKTTGAYGGLVYSYSTSGIKLWQPPRYNGYLIYVNDNWGGGAFGQSSNSAQLVVRAWSPYNTCPTTVATTSTNVPTSTAKTTSVNIVSVLSGKHIAPSVVGQSLVTNTSVLMKGHDSSTNTITSTDTFQGLSLDLPWWVVGVAGGVTLLLLIGSISGVVLGIQKVKATGKVETREPRFSDRSTMETKNRGSHFHEKSNDRTNAKNPMRKHRQAW